MEHEDAQPSGRGWEAWPVATTDDGGAGPAVDRGYEPPPVAPQAPPARRPRRRWPWAVALLLVAGAAAAAGAVALDQRDVAQAWRERALAVEGQRDQTLGRNESLELQLDEIARLLDISESDVADLESRIRELADEKAQAEDTATTVQVERDVFVDVTSRIADATEALDACVARLFDLQAASVDAFNRTTAGDPVDVEPLNDQARDTTEFCNQARSAAAGASAAAEQLLRP